MEIIAYHTQLVKNKAQELGFFFCGISKATFLEDEAPRLENYLKNQYNGKMAYLENHFDKRLDPRLLVEGAKSVVSLGFNYFPEKELPSESGIKISKYAYGEDYHFIIKDKLFEFMNYLQEEIGEVNGRVFVDSAPVLDKAWAKRAGMGWVGKHTLLISKEHGSFFFIAELILDLELNTDGPVPDYCGTCTKCIDECPTDAIVAPYVVDGSKCISYLTIELKDELLPNEFKGKMENWAFGCDICQDVCPWNRFSKKHTEPRLQVSEKVEELFLAERIELTEEIFNEIFRKSALKRTKFKGLQRNLDFLRPTQTNLE
ncbi:MAG: tRNA epoxyqueuosine(34) reductase QueG [Crocinitomicaceae bacterium]